MEYTLLHPFPSPQKYVLQFCYFESKYTLKYTLILLLPVSIAQTVSITDATKLVSSSIII
jgi:hypothetical protein